jgi:hypothetical protein
MIYDFSQFEKLNEGVTKEKFTVYHRTKYGVAEDFEKGYKVGGGAYHGAGLYTTQELNGQNNQKMINTYGENIVKFEVKNTGKFLILDASILQIVTGQNKPLIQQLKDILKEKFEKIYNKSKNEIDRLEKDLVKGDPNNPEANALIGNQLVRLPGILQYIDGVVYTGTTDGNCVLIYDTTLAVARGFAHVPNVIDTPEVNEARKKELEAIESTKKESSDGRIIQTEKLIKASKEVEKALGIEFKRLSKNLQKQEYKVYIIKDNGNYIYFDGYKAGKKFTVNLKNLAGDELSTEVVGRKQKVDKETEARDKNTGKFVDNPIQNADIVVTEFVAKKLGLKNGDFVTMTWIGQTNFSNKLDNQIRYSDLNEFVSGFDLVEVIKNRKNSDEEQENYIKLKEGVQDGALGIDRFFSNIDLNLEENEKDKIYDFIFTNILSKAKIRLVIPPNITKNVLESNIDLDKYDLSNIRFSYPENLDFPKVRNKFMKIKKFLNLNDNSILTQVFENEDLQFLKDLNFVKFEDLLGTDKQLTESIEKIKNLFFLSNEFGFNRTADKKLSKDAQLKILDILILIYQRILESDLTKYKLDYLVNLFLLLNDETSFARSGKIMELAEICNLGINKIVSLGINSSNYEYTGMFNIYDLFDGTYIENYPYTFKRGFIEKFSILEFLKDADDFKKFIDKSSKIEPLILRDFFVFHFDKDFTRILQHIFTNNKINLPDTNSVNKIDLLKSSQIKYLELLKMIVSLLFDIENRQLKGVEKHILLTNGIYINFNTLNTIFKILYSYQPFQLKFISDSPEIIQKKYKDGILIGEIDKLIGKLNLDIQDYIKSKPLKASSEDVSIANYISSLNTYKEILKNLGFKEKIYTELDSVSKLPTLRLSYNNKNESEFNKLINEIKNKCEFYIYENIYFDEILYNQQSELLNYKQMSEIEQKVKNISTDEVALNKLKTFINQKLEKATDIADDISSTLVYKFRDFFGFSKKS